MTTINGVTITDEAIDTIRELQEGDDEWLIKSLESMIDYILDYGSQKDEPAQRLSLITDIRSIELRIKSLSKLKEETNNE